MSCPTCDAASPAAATSHRGLNDQDSQFGLLGLIVLLGEKEKIPTYSVVKNGSQPRIKDGTYNHPAMILTQSTCGHLVYCAQVTSFSSSGFRGIHDKYAYARNQEALWRYLPIEHDESETHDPERQPDELETDRDTANASYMNLNSGYWIGWQYLRQYTSTTDGKYARLLPQSVNYATWAYATAERHRQRYGEDLQAKLARSASPPQARLASSWPPQARWKSPQLPIPVPVRSTKALSAAASSFMPGTVTSENCSTVGSRCTPAHRFDPLAVDWTRARA